MPRADTTPMLKTKDPTPMSISEVPQFSTFAKRRGKMRKSTARMAAQVMIIMPPRYMVTKGLKGKGFCFASCEVDAGFAVARRWRVGDGFAGDVRSRNKAGMTRNAFRRIGFDEWIVIAERMAPQFSRISVRHADAV
jgi:hypothetical protein